MKITDLKSVIEVSHPGLPASGQVLIYNGKILQDNIAISQCDIKENTFVVCMVKKKPATSAPPSAPVQASPPTTTNPAPSTSIPQTTSSVPQPVRTEQAPILTQPIPTQQPPQPRHQPRTAPEIPEHIIQEVINMGFPENEARFALQAAGGNPNLAIEYLFNGIPENSPFHQLAQPPNVMIASETTGIFPNAAPHRLEILRRHPQINTLRALYQQDPGSIAGILEQIRQSSPELFQLIHNNRDDFIRLLNEPIPNSNPTAQRQQQQQQQMNDAVLTPEMFLQQFQYMPPEVQRRAAELFGATPEQLVQAIRSLPQDEFQNIMSTMLEEAGFPEMGETEGMPQQQLVTLIEEEMRAVNRLMELGFSQKQAVEAFIAGDKNEELAANLLFSEGIVDNFGNENFTFQPPQPTNNNNNNPTHQNRRSSSSSSDENDNGDEPQNDNNDDQQN
jgi:UV excision repair protein RAD23